MFFLNDDVKPIVKKPKTRFLGGAFYNDKKKPISFRYNSGFNYESNKEFKTPKKTKMSKNKKEN